MKLRLKIIASALLLLNGSGAVYSGLNMVVYPNGSKIGLPVDLLKHSFFDSFLVPGLVLFSLIGLFNFYALIAVIASFKKYWLIVALQGVILGLWLVVQLAMIHLITIMHIIMMIVALLLIHTGNALAPYKSVSGHLVE